MLTPLDIVSKNFGKSMGGYNRIEVEMFLKEVSNDMDMLLEKNEHLHKQLKSMEGEVERFNRIEKNINDALVVAQSTANQVVHSANERASVILREAEHKAQKIVDESKDYAITLRRNSEDLRKEYEMFKSRLRSMLQSEVDALDKTYPAAPEIKTPAMIQALANHAAEEASARVTAPDVSTASPVAPPSVAPAAPVTPVASIKPAATLESVTVPGVVSSDSPGVSEATKPINAAKIIEAVANASKPLQALPGDHPLHVKPEVTAGIQKVGEHLPGHGQTAPTSVAPASTDDSSPSKEKLGKLQQEIRRLESEAAGSNIALLDEVLDAAGRKTR